MNEYPRMLVRYPAQYRLPAKLQDGDYDTRIVADADEHADANGEGWCDSTLDARAKHAASLQPVAVVVDNTAPVVDNAPPTRAELEAKATQLGIAFKPQWGDKKLADTIAAALE